MDARICYQWEPCPPIVLSSLTGRLSERWSLQNRGVKTEVLKECCIHDCRNMMDVGSFYQSHNSTHKKKDPYDLKSVIKEIFLRLKNTNIFFSNNLSTGDSID